MQITEAAHWHLRRETEPAVVWLRQLLYDVAVSVEDDAHRRQTAAGSADVKPSADEKAITTAGTTAEASPPRPDER